MVVTTRGELPPSLKVFAFWGLDLTHDGIQAKCDCPMCGKENKFSIEVETTKCRCWACGWTGNDRSFIRWLWEASDEATTDYESLALDRKLLYPETLLHWGAVESVTNGEWALPGYGTDGEIKTLYKYTYTNNRKVLLPSPTLGLYLFGVHLYNKKKPRVYLCEGPWDAMALWEVLSFCKFDAEGKLRHTSSKENCLLADSNVLAVPGCLVYSEKWNSLFSGKEVILLYDNDHPKPDGRGGTVEPPGYQGMRRTAKLLGNAPKSIKFLKWGEEGHDENLPSGYDLRDALTRG